MEARYSGILELVEKEEYAESRLLWRWSMLLEDLECNKTYEKREGEIHLDILATEMSAFL